MAERKNHTGTPLPAADWPPRASREALRLRAELLATVRRFFAERDVLEVDTPILSHATTIDPNIESLHTRYTGPDAATGVNLFLHTSPEFPMKRLLAAGSGSIYQVCHVFRDGENGRLHNPEFTMLEFYRVGFDHLGLLQETLALLTTVLAPHRRLSPAETLSYAEAFSRYAQIPDVHRADIGALRAAAIGLGLDADMVARADTQDILRDLLLTHVVEKKLGIGRLTAIYDYPVSQAALARIRQGEPAVAERFEIYLDSVELANGFHELADAAEQRRRFAHDQATRRAQNRTAGVVDERLLGALAAGLPDCAGAAVGFDRVVMLAAGETELARVLAFPLARA